MKEDTLLAVCLAFIGLMLAGLILPSCAVDVRRHRTLDVQAAERVVAVIAKAIEPEQQNLPAEQRILYFEGRTITPSLVISAP